MKAEPHAPEEVGKRLRLLRLAMGFGKMVPWCEFTGVGLSAWHNYENGRRRINLDEAVRVCGITGASLDWIYRGLEHSLPMHLAEKLRAVPNQIPSSERRSGAD